MRIYDEPVEVAEGRVGTQEAPERFRWRGRLLLVHEVLARWVETGAWWDAPEVRSVRGDDTQVRQRGRTTSRGRTYEGRSGLSATAQTRGRRGSFGGLPAAAVSDVWQTAADEWGTMAQRTAPATPDAEVDLLAEHELWRVMASTSTHGSDAEQGHGLYELDRSWGTGEWRLRAVLD